MSKWDKLINKLYSTNSELRFDEISKILYNLGCEARETKGGSSHITFRKKNKTPITIPRHGKIKKAYVLLIRVIFEEENKHE